MADSPILCLGTTDWSDCRLAGSTADRAQTRPLAPGCQFLTGRRSGTPGERNAVTADCPQLDAGYDRKRTIAVRKTVLEVGPR
jgi:hypothetical protein